MSRFERAKAVMLAAAAWGAASGCVASGTLDASERAAPAAGAEDVAWRPAAPADVPGLYSSTEIDGAAAAVLFEVHYWFDADGRFTGAALMETPQREYRVLSGAWRLEDGWLALSDEGEPARAEVAGDLLRLTGGQGTVVLERREGP